MKLTAVIIVGYHCYQIHRKFYPTFFSEGYPYIDEILGDQTLVDASKEVGIEVNAEKTKYMLLSCHKIQHILFRIIYL
jgi:hypothetical protein